MDKNRNSRRNFLKMAAACSASLALNGCGSLMYSKPGKKPNVLFIYSDDQTYQAIGAFGSQVQTPNLDRLASNGTTFTHAYNQGAWHGAVCVASRTMLNTGRFLWNARSIENELGQEVEGGRFWSQYMKSSGYDTYFSGKWHVKRVKPESVFDTVKNVRPGMPGTTKASYNRPVEGKPDAWSPYDKKLGGFWKGGKHWSEVLGDDGVEFLTQAKQSDNPFFMYLAFNAPHDPRQSPKEYVDKYPIEDVELPKSFAAEYPYKDDIGCSKKLRDEKLAPFPRTEYSIKVHRQEYYAIITHMDAQVGRILDALEKQGLADNTYVFFTSDHGLAVGSHGLVGKQNMYDHSMRVPLMVTGPGVEKNKRIDTPVYLQDIMPTTLELCGVQKPEQVQFKSLPGVIRGKNFKPYDGIYGGYKDLQRMISKDGYKLILYPKIGKARLYDLSKDPFETNDLAGNKKYSKRIKSLLKDLIELQKQTSDPINLRDIYSELLG